MALFKGQSAVDTKDLELQWKSVCRMIHNCQEIKISTTVA